MNTKNTSMKNSPESLINSTKFADKAIRKPQLSSELDPFDISELPLGFETCFTSAFFEHNFNLKETALKQKKSAARK